MGKICLFALFFVSLAYISPDFSFASETAVKVTVSGILHYGAIPSAHQSPGSIRKPDNQSAETEYWLDLEKPIVFAPGSKSQRVVEYVTLIFSPSLLEKAKEFDNRHVEVKGSMECTMHYTPWIATCETFVQQLHLSE